MFRKLPIILIVLISIILLINPYLPLEIKQNIYAISLTVKSLILMFLPIVIFALLFNAVVGLSTGATYIIVLILLFVCASNFISTFLSHYVGSWIYSFNLSLIVPKDSSGLRAAWNFEFPRFIENNKAMFFAVLLGLLLNKFKKSLSLKIATIFEKIINYTLKSFTLLIVLFVSGFVVKMQYDGTIHTIIKDYTFIFLVVMLAQYGYIFFVFAVINKFKLNKFIQSIKNMLPATVAGFSTMSSASVMPLTIMGIERNSHNKKLVKSIVPATVNIHLVGDCFAIPIFAYAVIKTFGITEPSLISYLVFVCYFVLAKFSVAAIPGGGIIVMLPILESCLGFNGQMLSLITALYILFDPVITSANILGNGMLAKVIDKAVSFRFKRKQQEATV
ncbi:cation:dicarboxylase symporter family transporter [Gammaproteobacteria bacterium]|nr:cation:dicarboxylase symporter family transporter [Gammaproteobacteria bacterium]